MADMHALAGLMRELENQLITCMHCGMCQAVCPLYAQTGKESDVARGKLALLDGLLKEMFEKPQSVAERLNKCLLCGSCQTNCPSGVNVLEIFIKARAILTGFMGLSAPQKAIFKGMLAHPERMDKMLFWGVKFQKIVTRPVNDLLGTSCARIGSALLGERHFKPLADEPFHQKTPSLNTPAGRSGLKVAFFVGCLIDKIHPQTAQAVMDVCKHLGVGLFIPEKQGCCGIPAISAGETATFERLVAHNVDKLKQQSFDHLVTACATCTSTIKKIWPVMVPDTHPQLKKEVLRLSKKTLDISQFLVDKKILADTGTIGKPRRADVPVTYHDPCHLKKSLGVFTQPRTLLRTAEDYHFREMRAADQCCGMGGSFNLRYYNLSSQIGERKGQAILNTGCRVVCTSCPACMLQLTDVLSKSNKPVIVKHVIEIFAEAVEKNANSTATHQT
jgi:glycolate oxidase iron-sulfur subunit